MAADIMFASVPKEILVDILDRDVIDMMTRISKLRSNENEVQLRLNVIVSIERDKEMEVSMKE